MYYINITLYSQDDTLGAVREVLQQAEELQLPDDLRLADGGQIGIGEDRVEDINKREGSARLHHLKKWVERQKNYPDETVVEYGGQLRINLTGLNWTIQQQNQQITIQLHT